MTSSNLIQSLPDTLGSSIMRRAQLFMLLYLMWPLARLIVHMRVMNKKMKNWWWRKMNQMMMMNLTCGLHLKKWECVLQEKKELLPDHWGQNILHSWLSCNQVTLLMMLWWAACCYCFFSPQLNVITNINYFCHAFVFLISCNFFSFHFICPVCFRRNP